MRERERDVRGRDVREKDADEALRSLIEKRFVR